jgi:hypothetical protein
LKTSKIVKFLNFEFVFALEGELLPKTLTLPAKAFYGFFVWSSSLYIAT